MPTNHGVKATSVLLFLIVLVGCGGGAPYKDVFNEGPRYNVKAFDEPVDLVWGASEIVLLAQGFRLQEIDKSTMTLVGTRLFKEDDETTTLVFSLTARPDRSGTTLFATATQTKEVFSSGTQYDWFLIFPRPTGTTEMNVKVGGETIEDPVFYEKFFKAVEKQISRAQGNSLAGARQSN